MASEIQYSELSSKKDSFTVINVRNLDEVKKDGIIPGSHVLPWTEMQEAMSLNPQEFQSKYKFAKPAKDSDVVVHCMMGGRAQKASDFLVSEGFNKIRCYKGSMKDWVANDGPIAPYE